LKSLRKTAGRIIDAAGKVIGKNIVYYQSAGKYVSIINFLLLLATFKAAYNIGVSAYFIIPIAFVFVMIVGVIDYKFIMRHQIAFVNEKNNILKEIRELRAEIELRDLERSKK